MNKEVYFRGAMNAVRGLRLSVVTGDQDMAQFWTESFDYWIARANEAKEKEGANV